MQANLLLTGKASLISGLASERPLLLDLSILYMLYIHNIFFKISYVLDDWTYQKKRLCSSFAQTLSHSNTKW